MECLAAVGFAWETVIENNSKWVIVDGFPVPEGYNHRSAIAALRIPPSYPDDQIDMVYFFTRGLRFQTARRCRHSALFKSTERHFSNGPVIALLPIRGDQGSITFALISCR